MTHFPTMILLATVTWTHVALAAVITAGLVALYWIASRR